MTVVEDRVLALEAVREDPQAVLPPPAEPSAQAAFEVLQQRAGHRVDHLLVEARIALAGCESVLGQQDRVVQIDRRVEPFRARVVVDDLHQIAARSGRNGSYGTVMVTTSLPDSRAIIGSTA